MDIRKIKTLIEMLEESNLKEIEVSQGDESVRISKQSNDIKIAKETTTVGFNKNSFIYDFMSSMRQKINDPLGVRKKRREQSKRD